MQMRDLDLNTNTAWEDAEVAPLCAVADTQSDC